MKRFYNHILSLLLLMVAGVTGAMAQNIQQGELLTTVDQVVGQDIFLNSIGQYGTGFAAGTGAYTSTLSKENVFRFEATGKTSADGHPTYYLKHVASGKYFEDYVIPMDNEDSSDAPKEGWDDPTGLTADKAQAIELVVCPFQTENAESTRDYATQGKNNENDLSFEGFVLTRAEFIPREGGETSVQFLGHLGKPFYSIYQDTNVWHIYGVDKEKGKDLLLNYNEYYFPGGSTLEGLYPVGTEIGTYNQTYYDAAKKVYDEFQAAINNYTLDDAAAQTLVVRLIEAMEALNTKGFNGFKPGYYYIHNMSGRTLYSQNVNGVDFLYSSNTNYTRPAEATLDDVKYIWRIDADRDADNALVMTNVLSGKSISGVKAAVVGVDDGYGFTLREDGKVKVELGTAAPVEGMSQKTFTFTSMEATVGGNGKKQFHAKFNDNAVMGWNASDDDRNNFYFTPVEGFTEDLKENLEKFNNVEQGEQTFHFKVDGVEYGSKTVYISSFLDIPTMSFLKRVDLNRTSDGYDFICTEKELPFVAQSTFDANTAQWYALNINGKSGNYLLSNKGGSIVSTTTVSLDNHPDVLEDAYLWAFVGNLKDGYRIYSKVDHKSLALYNQLILKKGNGSLFKLYEKSDKSNFGLYVDEGKLLTRESENKIVASTEDNNNDRSTFCAQKSKLYVTNYAKPFFTLLNENDTEAPENAIWGILYLNSPTNRVNYRALFLAANSDDATNEQIAALATENVKIANEKNVIPFEEGKYYRLYNIGDKERWLNSTNNNIKCNLNAEKAVSSVVKFDKMGDHLFGMDINGLSIGVEVEVECSNRFRFVVFDESFTDYYGVLRNDGFEGTNDEYACWLVVPATEAEIAMSEVNGKSYASAYLPFPVNGISGAEAYVGKLNDAKDMLNMTQVQGVAANTGFVLVGNADKATLSIGETTETATSDLKGSNTNIVISSPIVDLHDQYLVFGVNDGNVGFYAPSYYLETIPANKAYLETDQLASKAIAMNFGGNVTGVSQATVVANEDAPIYDLSGRRVAKAVKGGVYIQNGKKFVKLT